MVNRKKEKIENENSHSGSSKDNREFSLQVPVSFFLFFNQMPRIGGGAGGCRLARIVGRHCERVLRTEMKLLDGESESRRSGAGGHRQASKLAFSGVPRRERIDMMRALHTTWSFAIV